MVMFSYLGTADNDLTVEGGKSVFSFKGPSSPLKFFSFSQSFGLCHINILLFSRIGFSAMSYIEKEDRMG